MSTPAPVGVVAIAIGDAMAESRLRIPREIPPRIPEAEETESVGLPDPLDNPRLYIEHRINANTADTGIRTDWLTDYLPPD